jgi:Icc-related predicted phosphoesterase
MKKIKKQRVLFFTDIHQNIDAVRKLSFDDYDLIFCGGDILDPSKPDAALAKKIIDLFPGRTFIIPGNCDKDESLIEYMKSKLNYIHKVLTSKEDTQILGIGYSRSLKSDMEVYRNYFLEDYDRIKTFHKENHLNFILDFCGIQIKDDKINILDFEEAINASKDFFDKFVSFEEDEVEKLFTAVNSLSDGFLVTHSPPFGSLDKLDGLPHIGSVSIAAGIKKTRPKIVLCGHFHELVSSTKIGDTIIFNPGAIKDNKYGEIIIEEKEIKINFRNF